MAGMHTKRWKATAATAGVALVAASLVGCSSSKDAGGATAAATDATAAAVAAGDPCGNLQVLATSDVHDYLEAYDYFTDSPLEAQGMVKVATLIAEQRKAAGTNNTILVDNGDLIQGNPLGDYYATTDAKTKPGEQFPPYLVLDKLQYDIAGAGNHEFNFGLDFLNQILKDTKTPFISGNVYDAAGDKTLFEPFKILDKTITAPDGTERPVKVGVTSVVPPQIMQWDASNLEGKASVKDMVESAKTNVAAMQAAGAQVIIVMTHSGPGTPDGEANAENAAYDISKIPGVNAIVAGHTHATFPMIDPTAPIDAEMAAVPGVDAAAGTLNGIPMIQPAFYASGLGVIDIPVNCDGDTVAANGGTAKMLSTEGVASDKALTADLKSIHKAVIKYVNSPVGSTSIPINSFFSLVADSSPVQIISESQIWWAKNQVKTNPDLAEFKDLPILSAAAPFKAGLGKDGTNATDYIDIPKGELSIKDMSNLYKYPNTAVIMKINGKGVKNWLEMSQGLYAEYDPAGAATDLFSTTFPAFNFDVIDGVTYKVDLSQKPKYDSDAKEINPDSSRVVDLQLDGKAVTDDQEFLIVTNNYRAGGGGSFPITDDSSIVLASSDETRTILSNWVQKYSPVAPKPDNNWTMLTLKDAKAQPKFLSATKGESFAKNYTQVVVGKAAEKDLTNYTLDLTK